MTRPEPNVARWLQENRRPERTPDPIYRRGISIPIALAALVGLGMAIGNAPQSSRAPDPSPYVPVRVMATTHTTVAGLCDLQVRDGRGDGGTLHRQPCQRAGSTTFAYLNSQRNLQASAPLKKAHAVIRDVFAGVIWFGIVLPFFGLASWLICRRMLGRRHGRAETAALIDV